MVATGQEAEAALAALVVGALWQLQFPWPLNVGWAGVPAWRPQALQQLSSAGPQAVVELSLLLLLPRAEHSQLPPSGLDLAPLALACQLPSSCTLQHSGAVPSAGPCPSCSQHPRLVFPL